MINKTECLRCGHKWYPKDPNNPPQLCPKCKSYYYDKPRGLAPRKRVK